MSAVMNTIGVAFAYAVLALFAQNAIFTRGLGVSRLIQLVGDERTSSWWFALLLCVTQTLVAPLAYFAGSQIVDLPYRAQLRPLLYLACVAVVCIFEHAILRAVKGPRSGLLIRILPIAAVNSGVLGTVLVERTQSFTLAQSIGFGLGSGLGYLLAVMLVTEADRRLRSEAIPEAFRGLPITLIYIGVLALLIVSSVSNPNLLLSFPYNGGGAINLYTVLFILCFGIGYGAYYATADMPIPMVADCSDYETYRSGKYIPGIMGTLFSLVDKLVSSLAQTLVALIFLWCAGLSELPTDATPYSTGIKVAVIIMFCVIPMLAWAATLWAMKGYSLTGAKMKEIQAVNRARKAAVNDGMTLEQAMDTIKTTEDAEKYQTTGGKTAAM